MGRGGGPYDSANSSMSTTMWAPFPTLPGLGIVVNGIALVNIGLAGRAQQGVVVDAGQAVLADGAVLEPPERQVGKGPVDDAVVGLSAVAAKVLGAPHLGGRHVSLIGKLVPVTVQELTVSFSRSEYCLCVFDRSKEKK